MIGKKQPVNVPDKPEAQEAPLRQAEENFDFAGRRQCAGITG